jgi:hypothetical protein
LVSPEYQSSHCPDFDEVPSRVTGDNRSSDRAGAPVGLAGTDVDDELTRTRVAAEMKAVNQANDVHLANFNQHHARAGVAEAALNRAPG